MPVRIFGVLLAEELVSSRQSRADTAAVRNGEGTAVMLWTRGQKAGLIVCLAGSALMIAGSFMPWLSGESFRTLSGWDIYRAQVGSAWWDRFVIWNFFTASDGSSVPFFTGLVTLLGGVWLAAWTAALFVVYGLVHPRRSPGRFDWRGGPHRIFHALVVVPAAVAGLENTFFYYDGGASSGADLEYGLILVWVATAVGSYASLSTNPAFGTEGLLGRLRRRHSGSTTPHPR